MQDLKTLNELIDLASKIAGSDYKLAAALGAPRQHVSNWRHGKRTCTPEDMAVMASIAGLDAERVLVRATIEKHEGTKKGDMLMKALGKAWRATGGISVSAGVAALGTYLTHWGDLAHSTMYIM